MFWDTPKRPELIEQIHKYNMKHIGGWTMHFLDEQTVYDYIPKSSFPSKYNGLKTEHKADWIRLTLLSKYGGLWSDASILLNDSTALDQLRQESIDKRSALAAFSFKNSEPGQKTLRGISLYIENYFIMAPKESIIIKLWLEEYTRAINMGFLAYRKDLKRAKVNTDRIFSHQYSTYLTQHACLQKVLQVRLKQIPPMIIRPSEESILKIRHECKHDSVCIMTALKDEPKKWKAIPYIKLVGVDRSTGIDISPYFEE